MRSHSRLLRAAWLACAFPPALAAQDSTVRRLPPVVVTRDPGRSPIELPYAITSVRPDSLAPGQTHTLVDQTLALIPGLTVANRNNPSQDTRVSIRGFGARSAFGVRSIRVLRDGMPLTLPDGQTPIDYLDIESVSNVETIRGTASALYGNASGGVIDLRSAPPPDDPFAVQLRTWSGANGLRRYVGMLGGTQGGATFTGNIGRTTSDGVRTYAAQRVTNAFARATASVPGTELSVIGLGMDMPQAQNPGALTRAQFDADPTQADAQSVLKRARKEVHQVQVGVSAHTRWSDGSDVYAQAYGGGRSLYNPLTFAIVGIDRHTGGASVRATFLPGYHSRHRLTVGADAQRLSDARKNWSNCNGVAAVTANCTSLGVEKGRLQLDQREIVTSIGPYIRDEVELGDGRVLATAAVRSDNTTFELRDAFLTDGRDDSGKRTMRAVSPMGGVALRLATAHSVYANVSTAFETPTTTELGNQADGSAGLNRALDPQHSTTYEVGLKGLARERLQYDVALFTTSVRDELVPFDIGSGRTAFRNAGRTRRRGGEASAVTEIGPVRFAAAYTHSHFRFVDFTSGTTQVGGKAIPGIPERQLQASATLRARRTFVVADWLAKSKVYVNDANAAAAPGFAIANVRVGTTAGFGRPRVTPVFGVQNVFDRKYVGSVAINAAGTVTTAKFYEPGPGRTWFVGLSAATAPW